MIGCGSVVFMEFFEIVDEVVDSLGIKELQQSVSTQLVFFLVILMTSTLRMIWEGSVLSIALKYCCIAVS